MKMQEKAITVWVNIEYSWNTQEKAYKVLGIKCNVFFKRFENEQWAYLFVLIRKVQTKVVVSLVCVFFFIRIAQSHCGYHVMDLFWRRIVCKRGICIRMNMKLKFGKYCEKVCLVVKLPEFPVFYKLSTGHGSSQQIQNQQQQQQQQQLQFTTPKWKHHKRQQVCMPAR